MAATTGPNISVWATLPALVATMRPISGDPTKVTLRTASWAIAASSAVGLNPVQCLVA